MAYVGEYRERLRDGRGSYTFPSGGFKYEGEWKRGRMNGRGIFSLPDGGSYEGEFADGEIQGIGLRRWPDGSTYSGQFHCGERHGEGVHIAASGEVYEGHWANNQRHGLGELRMIDGSVYRGDFHQNKPHGNGRIKFSEDSSSYDGDWVNGSINGRGVLKSRQGTVLYDGEWFNGSRCGHGVGLSVLSSSIVYSGIWSDNKPIVETKMLGFKIPHSAAPASETDANNKTIYENLPDSITVVKKDGSRLPTLVVASLCETQSGGDTSIVEGESGRKLRLRLYGGLREAKEMGSAAGEDLSPGQELDGSPEGGSTRPQCSFAIVQNSSSVSCVTTPEEDSLNASEGTDPTPPGQEVLVDEVVVSNAAGVAFFNNLALPSELPVGTYQLNCDSMNDESVSIINSTILLVE